MRTQPLPICWATRGFCKEIMASNTLVEHSSAPRAAFYRQHQELLARLAREGQSPQTLFIGCDDARVLPERITGAEPGDLFVLRVIANIVPPYGTGEHTVGATLEYAVHHLQVQHIILCGHIDCGGIRALDAYLDQLKEPHLARWLEYARPAQTQVDARGVDSEGRHRAIVEQNVLLQLDNLHTYGAVRQALQASQLKLHGWVYDLSTGRVSYWDADSGRFLEESDPSDTSAVL